MSRPTETSVMWAEALARGLPSAPHGKFDA